MPESPAVGLPRLMPSPYNNGHIKQDSKQQTATTNKQQLLMSSHRGGGNGGVNGMEYSGTATSGGRSNHSAPSFFSSRYHSQTSCPVNASPESAMSPSLSSVATSTSEVSLTIFNSFNSYIGLYCQCHNSVSCQCQNDICQCHNDN